MAHHANCQFKQAKRGGSASDLRDGAAAGDAVGYGQGRKDGAENLAVPAG